MAVLVLIAAAVVARLGDQEAGTLRVDSETDEIAVETVPEPTPRWPTAEGHLQGLPPTPTVWAHRPAAVWTGRELLLWGQGIDQVPQGAAYDPAAGDWTPLPPAPIESAWAPIAVWAAAPGAPAGHGELVVWDLRGTSMDGAAYDPRAGTWRPISGQYRLRPDLTRWTGTEVVSVTYPLEGDDPPRVVAYDPATDSWRTLPELPGDGWPAALIWTGEEIVTVIGLSQRQQEAVEAGELRGPVTLGWQPGDDNWTEYPPPRLRSTETLAAVAAGRRMALWAGMEPGGGHPGRLLLFSPASRTWAETPMGPVGARQGAALVWTGRHVLVWGGEYHRAPLSNGALYDPQRRTWELVPDEESPPRRGRATAVWADGQAMIVAGDGGAMRPLAWGGGGGGPGGGGPPPPPPAPATGVRRAPRRSSGPGGPWALRRARRRPSPRARP